ncbi:hypothetical protein [Nonomuraea sp. B5E05]|uniref:hypothetical protein n=1 Tax=Nonomuraea sp. B5E05 TaxID=3153569 RepID=UPI0032605BAB
MIMLISLVFAQFAFIVARESGFAVAGALGWGGGTFIAVATLVTTIMSHAGAFDQGRKAP